MATTYEPIATVTTSGSANNVTFSSIPQTYTDLRVIFNATPTAADAMDYWYNGVRGTSYSYTRLIGDGASATSGASTSQAQIRVSQSAWSSTTIPYLITIDIFNYTGSTYKTSLSTTSIDKNGSGYSSVAVGLFSNTSAITSLTIGSQFNPLASGGKVTLYGIKAA